MDTDLPTYLEAELFCNTFGKLCWVTLQPFSYALRPIVMYPTSPTNLEIISVTVQLAFDAVVITYVVSIQPK
jgi:sphingolipid delta-4 desaturase